jgi:hypothetical protein
MKDLCRQIILAAFFTLPACGGHGVPYEKKQPAKILQDAQGKYLELTSEAVKRLGIIERQASLNAPIPLSALLYDSRGTTSVFVREAAGRYRRRTVEIAGQDATIFRVTSGLEPGAGVVVTGAAELNGTEEGVGK